MAKWTKKRRITNAYEAWYFLHDHPKLNRKERDPLAPEEVEEAKRPARRPAPDDEIGQLMGRRKGFRVVVDKGGNHWREWPLLTVPALSENFDIHYAKVDGRGRVNKDESKNVNAAVWLELGPVEWGYHQPKYEAPKGARCYKIHFHDVDLDCGAPTFDEALIKLARLVMKKYGDYPTEQWHLLRPKRRAD